jgi:ribosome recycling factor
MDAKVIKEAVTDHCEKTLKSLHHNLTKVRTGRASASILDGIMVDYYGAPTPIKQTGQISTPEARLLQIQPFDKTLIPAIEKAIFAANIGVTPSNDGNLVRLPFPALTEDKRKDLVKDVKRLGEDGKIAIRNSRRDYNDQVKKSEKDKEISEDESKKIQKEIQDVVDGFIAKIDSIVSDKEKELLTV